MAKKRHHDGHYAGFDARRTQEMQDSGMIHSDFQAVANLPQNVMYKSWMEGDSKYYTPERLDDGPSGVEFQKNYDGSKMMKDLEPKKV